jgi:hypothetical protein
MPEAPDLRSAEIYAPASPVTPSPSDRKVDGEHPKLPGVREDLFEPHACGG